ncbi:MAG: DUF2948 family protein [Pseudomonadota bacterium]
MSDDARFEDGVAKPLRLKAISLDDLEVVSALVQDAIFPATEMQWDRAGRRFAVLLNRFRWEDQRATPERVQTVLVVEDVQRVQTQGVTRDADTVLSLLAVGFQPGEDGTGRIELTLAGDGAIGIDVEALEIVLRDVTRPYVAPSGFAPDHPD